METEPCIENGLWRQAAAISIGIGVSGGGGAGSRVGIRMHGGAPSGTGSTGTGFGNIPTPIERSCSNLTRQPRSKVPLITRWCRWCRCTMIRPCRRRCTAAQCVVATA